MKSGKTQFSKKLLNILLTFCLVIVFSPTLVHSVIIDPPLEKPTNLSLLQVYNTTYAQWNNNTRNKTFVGEVPGRYSFGFELDLFKRGTENKVQSWSGEYDQNSDTMKVDLSEYFNQKGINGGYYFKVKDTVLENGSVTDQTSEWSDMSDVIWVSESEPEINSVEVNTITFDYLTGSTPQATATVENDSYIINFESWIEMDQNTPVAYWYSNNEYNSWYKKITCFEAGKTYKYSISLQAKDGFKFSDNINIKINNQEVQITPDMITLSNDRKNCLIDNLKSITITAHQLIDTIEINGVTKNFKIGDKPIFTAEIPEGLTYYINYEMWEGNDKSISSEELTPSDALLNEFEKDQKYSYSICLKLNPAINYEFANPLNIKLNGELVTPEDIIITDEYILLRNLFSMVPDTAKIVEGTDKNWNPNSENGLVFKCDANYSDFMGILVDGNEIDSTCYIIKEGSIIVELKPEYLKTLSQGTHTLTIKTNIGDADTSFTIGTSEITVKDEKNQTDLKSEEDNNTTLQNNLNIPKTGETYTLIIWESLLFMSISLIALTMISNNKNLYFIK